MARERRTAGPRPREAELIARWGAGVWRGRTLRAESGDEYTIVYQGRPGGGTGPDFRDAVLLDAGGARLTGDVELHLTPAGWRAHGHAANPHYNNVALHVTLRAGSGLDATGAPLASGRRAPLVALAAQPGEPVAATHWPLRQRSRPASGHMERAVAAGWLGAAA